MARRSRIEPVREFLRDERSKIITKIDDAIKAEEFLQAENLKEFRRILSVAIQLCGEREIKEETISGVHRKAEEKYFGEFARKECLI